MAKLFCKSYRLIVIHHIQHTHINIIIMTYQQFKIIASIHHFIISLYNNIILHWIRLGSSCSMLQHLMDTNINNYSQTNASCYNISWHDLGDASINIVFGSLITHIIIFIMHKDNEYWTVYWFLWGSVMFTPSSTRRSI